MSRRRRRRSRGLQALGDAGLTVGMARGLTQHRGSNPADDALLARAAMLDHAPEEMAEERSPGLLDRVPGWLILLVAGVLFAAILLFTTWR